MWHCEERTHDGIAYAMIMAGIIIELMGWFTGYNGRYNENPFNRTSRYYQWFNGGVALIGIGWCMLCCKCCLASPSLDSGVTVLNPGAEPAYYGSQNYGQPQVYATNSQVVGSPMAAGGRSPVNPNMGNPQFFPQGGNGVRPVAQTPGNSQPQYPNNYSQRAGDS